MRSGDHEVAERGREAVEDGQSLLLELGRVRAAERERRGVRGRRQRRRRVRRQRRLRRERRVRRARRAGAVAHVGRERAARGQRRERAAGRGRLAASRLLGVVHEVAARAVRAEPHGVERAAQLGLVLGVALQVPELADAVSELALVAVLAHAGFLEGPAEFGLVAAGGGRRRRGVAGGALEAAVAEAGEQAGERALRGHGRRSREHGVLLPGDARHVGGADRRERAAQCAGHRLHWASLVLK